MPQAKHFRVAHDLRHNVFFSIHGLNSQEMRARCRSSAAAAPKRASSGSRAATDRDAELFSGAQDDAKELRSELAKSRQRYA